MDAIRTVDLRKKIGGKCIVDKINLHIGEGEIYGFIGQNGAGKSTTLKMLCGLEKPSEGTIKIYGEQLTHALDKKKIGALIEQPGIVPSFSASENMQYKADILGMKSTKNEIKQILENVGIYYKDKKHVSRYSSGMKQRLGIAIALLGHPEILILDEPMNGLDPEGMCQIRELLVELNKKEGTTILISSHILGELEKMATKYGILCEGKLVQEITCEELINRCQDYFYIKVSDALKVKKILESELKIINCTVHGTESIKIFDKVDSQQISKILLKHGVVVKEFYNHNKDYDEYFIDIMKGTSNERTIKS